MGEMMNENNLSTSYIEEPGTIARDDKPNEKHEKNTFAGTTPKSANKLSVISKSEKKRVFEYEKE